MKVPGKGLIDLHVHLDGSLSFDMARTLAKMQGMDILSDEELRRRMRAPADCRNLNDYLTKFDYPLELLQSEEAIAYSVREILKLQKSQGLVYSELRFAPQLHTRKGLSQERVIAAAVRGLRRFEKEEAASEEAAPGKAVLGSALILCCMRGSGNEAMNMETVEIAEEYLGEGVAALDLAGAEALFPTKAFEELFREARKRGIPFTIHAGEADGPESIWNALEFGAVRIGHGVRCLEDQVLVRRLAKDGIPLELCPTSNMNTKIFKNIKDYPILKLLDEGIKITINTDNMTVSNTTVRNELQLVADAFHLSNTEIDWFIKNAAESAFTHR